MRMNNILIPLLMLSVLACAASRERHEGQNDTGQPKPSVPQVLVPSEARVIRTGASVKPPKVIQQPLPIYPPEAKTQGVEGEVELMVQVDKQGNASKLCLLRGNPKLVGASVEAIWQWKWEPLLLDSQPYEFETSILVKFRLK